MSVHEGYTWASLRIIVDPLGLVHGALYAKKSWRKIGDGWWVDLRCVFVPLALAFVQRLDGHENRTSSETRHGGRLETDGLGKSGPGGGKYDSGLSSTSFSPPCGPCCLVVLPHAAPRGRSPDRA